MGRKWEREDKMNKKGKRDYHMDCLSTKMFNAQTIIPSLMYCNVKYEFAITMS